MSIRRFCTGQAPGTNTRRSPEPVSGIFGIEHTSKTISHGNLKNITSSRHRGVSPPTPLPPRPSTVLLASSHHTGFDEWRGSLG